MRQGNKIVRLCSLLLTIVMLFSSLGTSVLATNVEGTIPNIDEKAIEQTQVETQSETQSEIQVETQVETQAEIQVETQVETQAETQVETQAETQTETQTETQVETQAETQTETQAETQAETIYGENPDETEKMTEEELEKPAQTITATTNDGATVIITAPQGALPDGAQVIAQEIASAAIENAVADAVAAEGKLLIDYKAYDITIIDAEGNVIQPDSSVQVTINNAGVAGEETAVYHVEGATADKITEVPGGGGGYAAFAAEHFSIYVVAGSQTEQPEIDEVLVTYNMIYDNGVAVVPPDTVAYVLKKDGIETEYAITPQQGYTITMAVEGEGAEYFSYENGKVLGSFAASGNYNVILTYTPNEIRYTVTHYYQNVDRTDYIADPQKDQLIGKVNTMTEAQERWKEGFTVQQIEQLQIPQNAKDDKINIEVYYNRKECLLLYNTMGGSYIESQILAYGAQVDLPSRLSSDAPVREGYNFTGWYADAECTIPIENNKVEVLGETTVYAGWEGTEVEYTVVYMGENANDEEYSYITSKKFTAKAGEVIQINSHTHGLTKRDYNEIEHFTFEDRGASDKIMSDGSSVLLVYYKRNEYTITFTGEGLTCQKTEHTHIRPNAQNSCYILTCTNTNWFHIHTVKGGCYSLICGLDEHQHSSQKGCYSEITKTITAKYQQDISKLWNDAVGPGTPLEGNNWAWEGQMATAFQTTMPGEDKNLTPKNNGNTRHVLRYYIEDPNGTVNYGEKTFQLYTEVVLNVSSNARPTFNEEFFVIDGYERYASTIDE